jgi:soluble lytic murein transglycosylase
MSVRFLSVVMVLGLAVGCTKRSAPAPSPAPSPGPDAAANLAPESPPPAPALTVDQLGPYFETGPLAAALDAYHAGENARAATIFDAYVLDRDQDDERIRSASLLALLAHHDAGHWQPTGERLDALAARWPLLGDYASFFAGSAHFGAEQNLAAVASLERVGPDSTLRGRAVALRARALARLDRGAEARALLELDLEREADQLSHWRLLADLHRAAGDPGPLHASLRELASRYPHLEAGRVAHRSLGTKPGLSLAQRLGIARVFHSRHAHKKTVRALESLLRDAPPGDNVWCQATVMLGRTLEKMKKRPKAWPHFEAALRCEGDALATATFSGGRNRLRAEAYEAAESLLSHHLESFGDRTTADDAALMRADAARRAGHEDLADQRLLDQLRRWPKGDMADAAAWALLWPRISREAWAEAVEMADRALELVPRERSYRAEGRTAYWRAVALHELGRAEEALAGWTDVLRAYPLSWYALLAHERLARAGKAEEAMAGVLGSVQVPADPLARIPDALALSVRFKKGVALARLGLSRSARREFARLVPTGDAGQRRAWTWTLVALYDQVGAHDLATSLARGEEPWLGQTWPVGTMRRLWELAHPLAYEQLVRSWAQERKITPFWIWSIMREESSFNPTIESWANAVGLMQIIIPTAKALARGTTIPPTKASLRKPAVAIELGSKLLAQLFAQHPSIPLASTGYNAGSRATARWRRDFGHLELDRLVEHITYREARGYAKRVSRSVARYSWLYGGAAAATDQGDGERPGRAPALWTPGLDPPDPR